MVSRYSRSDIGRSSAFGDSVVPSSAVNTAAVPPVVSRRFGDESPVESRKLQERSSERVRHTKPRSE